jgi:serine O-acetyltransferase
VIVYRTFFLYCYSFSSYCRKNFTVSQGVTIGITNRGSRKGDATIGYNVYVESGAKIVGKDRIGDNVAIGANAVVTNDLPPSAVAVGIPAKIISFKGSEGYVNNNI